MGPPPGLWWTAFRAQSRPISLVVPLLGRHRRCRERKKSSRPAVATERVRLAWSPVTSTSDTFCHPLRRTRAAAFCSMPADASAPMTRRCGPTAETRRAKLAPCRSQRPRRSCPARGRGRRGRPCDGLGKYGRGRCRRNARRHRTSPWRHHWEQLLPASPPSAWPRSH
jgi:hypothetical protein